MSSHLSHFPGSCPTGSEKFTKWYFSSIYIDFSYYYEAPYGLVEQLVSYLHNTIDVQVNTTKWDEGD